MKKNEIPLTILHIIKPYLSTENNNYELDRENTESFFKLKDKDSTTGFYFELTSFPPQKGKAALVTTKYKPYNENDISEHSAVISAGDLARRIDQWANILQGYKNFDDHILKQYADEYFTELDPVDEDADVKPFSTQQILLLDAYLETIAKEIDEFKTEKNANEIQLIKDEIVELKTTMTASTKRSVIKSLAKIFARVKKQGVDPMKKFLGETVLDTIKDVIKDNLKEVPKYLIQNAPQIIQQIGESFDKF